MIEKLPALLNKMNTIVYMLNDVVVLVIMGLKFKVERNILKGVLDI